MTINFDNSATSYPKPQKVLDAIDFAVKRCGGNAGRGGHKLSLVTSEQVFLARERVAEFFKASAEDVVFTLNCTHSLNIAIFGTVREGDHVLISNLEHNSVARPVYYLAKNGLISYSTFKVGATDEETVANFKSSLRPNTGLVVTTIASNVTGQILPFRKIGAICKERGICYVADGSQGCGVLPISLEDDNVNILCSSGHKALYGATASGILVSDGKYHIRPLMYGGTGSTSTALEQPNFLPDSLESGTLNTVGIVSLRYGIEHVNSIGIDTIHNYEQTLCNILLDGLKTIPNVIVYRNSTAQYLPIVSFNVEGVPSNVVGEYLSENNLCLRAGFHCSALAHRSLNTTTGTVRFSPSIFNRPSEVRYLVTVLKDFCYHKKKSITI